jgi:hypothetical protein
MGISFVKTTRGIGCRFVHAGPPQRLAVCEPAVPAQMENHHGRVGKDGVEQVTRWPALLFVQLLIRAESDDPSRIIGLGVTDFFQGCCQRGSGKWRNVGDNGGHAGQVQMIMRFEKSRDDRSPFEIVKLCITINRRPHVGFFSDGDNAIPGNGQGIGSRTCGVHGDDVGVYYQGNGLISNPRTPVLMCCAGTE